MYYDLELKTNHLFIHHVKPHLPYIQDFYCDLFIKVHFNLYRTICFLKFEMYLLNTLVDLKSSSQYFNVLILTSKSPYVTVVTYPLSTFSMSYLSSYLLLSLSHRTIKWNGFHSSLFRTLSCRRRPYLCYFYTVNIYIRI